MIAWLALTAAFAGDPATDPGPPFPNDGNPPITAPEAPTAPPTAPPPPPVVIQQTDPALMDHLAEQQIAIADLQQQLAALQLEVHPPEKDLTLGLEGWVRTRGYMYGNLFAAQTDADGKMRPATVMSNRVQLRPYWAYKDEAKLFLEVRALEDVAWGDNAGLQDTALFAEQPSETSVLTGQEVPSIRLSRAWMEFKIPVGQIRIGRMPSNWGMGILANSGDGFDDDFGENHNGSTVDRALFATRPVAIVQKAMGHEDTEVPLIFAVGVDRLSEDPLVQYYGYECTPGIAKGSSDYDVRCDGDGDGTTDLDHGYTDDTRTEDTRGQDWWIDPDDDVFELVYVLIYRGEDVRWLGDVGDLQVGTYVVTRFQRETDSRAVVLDGYAKLENHGFNFEAEGIAITGQTSAIALPGAVNTEGDPLAKKAGIAGYAAKLGYGGDAWRVQLENGYASGDDNVADENFTGRALHADYNVGLLLYEEVLARTTQSLWGEPANGLWSDGGVYNSVYLMPTARVSLTEGNEIVAGFLTAYPDKPDGARIVCNSSDNVDCQLPASQQAQASALGWEADLAIKQTFHEHLLFSLEGGYAKVTDRVRLSGTGLDEDGKFWTLQSRIGWQF